ncbi:DMT family transporter [Saccharothrix australiensis]|uniref:Quaternary ammonium compound-resistance protein SugE n=1 Tax=Saccharothrix australiensis TaxID=2072 RepID=A0A495W2Y9_9PSEU|nr:quaternary ammonium compound-resistance protein SugE [Saccharothrix australiensis]
MREHDVLDEARAKAKAMTVAWVILVGAGFLEIIWAISMKHSEGFTRLWPTVIGLVTAWTSFILLTFALKSLPVATAYAVWAGIGAVGTAVVGIVLLGEGTSPLRVLFLSLITIGIVGLHLIGG